MKTRGPLVTLAAVAILGIGILLVNISKEDKPQDKAAPPTTTTVVAGTTAPPPPTTTAPRPAFPAKADYNAKIPTARSVIALGINVDGAKAVAYACDGNAIESWLRGDATDGAVHLKSKDGSGRLEGRLEGTAIVGTLWIGGQKWAFTAAAAAPPAGVYSYDSGGVRNSWVVDPSGAVTGVQRQVDGTTGPAPSLTPDGKATINGTEISAVRVLGGSDV